MKKWIKDNWLHILILAILFIGLIFLRKILSSRIAAIMIFAFAVIVKVLLETKDKNVVKIILIIVVEFFIGLGLDGIAQMVDNRQTPINNENNLVDIVETEEETLPTVLPSPEPDILILADSTIEPTPTVQSLHVSGLSYYGRQIWKNITSTNYMLSLGTANNYVVSNDMDKLCRKFELLEDGTLTLSFSYFYDKERKNGASQGANVKNTDDWRITIVSGSYVIYNGIVNRSSAITTFEYSLSKGLYYIVIQRLSGNNTHWYITADTTFHAK